MRRRPRTAVRRLPLAAGVLDHGGCDHVQAAAVHGPGQLIAHRVRAGGLLGGGQAAGEKAHATAPGECHGGRRRQDEERQHGPEQLGGGCRAAPGDNDAEPTGREHGASRDHRVQTRQRRGNQDDERRLERRPGRPSRSFAAWWRPRSRRARRRRAREVEPAATARSGLPGAGPSRSASAATPSRTRAETASPPPTTSAAVRSRTAAATARHGVQAGQGSQHPGHAEVGEAFGLTRGNVAHACPVGRWARGLNTWAATAPGEIAVVSARQDGARPAQAGPGAPPPAPAGRAARAPPTGTRECAPTGRRRGSSHRALAWPRRWRCRRPWSPRPRGRRSWNR